MIKKEFSKEEEAIIARMSPEEKRNLALAMQYGLLVAARIDGVDPRDYMLDPRVTARLMEDVTARMLEEE